MHDVAVIPISVVMSELADLQKKRALIEGRMIKLFLVLGGCADANRLVLKNLRSKEICSTMQATFLLIF